MKNIVILPGQGIEGLRFGSSREEVKKFLGDPQEEERFGEEGFPDTLIWHYHDRGVSLFFEDEKNETFSCIEISHDTAVLWGKKVFELKEEDIISLFKSKGYNDIDSEVHEWGEKRVSFEDAMVDLYFEEDSLTSINFGMVLSDPNMVIFPN